MNIELISIIVWTAIFLLFTHYLIRGTIKNKGTKEYALAGKNLNGFQLGMSIIASYIGGGTLIAFSGQISTYGYAFIGVVIGVTFAFILLALFAPKYIMDTNGTFAVTMTERLKMAYGDRILLPSIVIILITLFSFIAIQLYGGALLISEILNINFVFSALILTAIAGLYSTLGGSRADVYTDIFQGIMIIAAILYGVITIFNQWPPYQLSKMFDKTPDLLNFVGQGSAFLVAMVILPIFAIHTDPSIQFRLYMARDISVARRGIILGAIVYLLFIISLIFLVLGIVGTTGMSGDHILISYASSLEGKAMSVLITLAIYSAVISTMDSQAIKTATILVHDVFSKFDSNIEANDESEGIHIKKMIPQVFLIGFVLSVCMYIVKSAFFILSLVWVISIASFGVLLVGMWFPSLQRTLKYYVGFVRFEMLLIAVIIICGSLYLGVTRAENASANLLVGGTAIVIIKLTLYSLLYVINKSKINATT